MEDINQLTDDELRDELALHMGAASVPPVTETTRNLMRRKLYRLRSGQDFVSVCSNPEDGDSDGHAERGTHPRPRISSPTGAATAASGAAAASSTAMSFDSSPPRPSPASPVVASAAAAAASTSFGGSAAVGASGGGIFRETYRRRPLHEDDSGAYDSARAASPYKPAAAARPQAAPARRRWPLVTCLLAGAFVLVVGYLLLHVDPLYENPVPVLSH